MLLLNYTYSKKSIKNFEIFKSNIKKNLWVRRQKFIFEDPHHSISILEGLRIEKS